MTTLLGSVTYFIPIKVALMFMQEVLAALALEFVMLYIQKCCKGFNS